MATGLILQPLLPYKVILPNYRNYYTIPENSLTSANPLLQIRQEYLFLSVLTQLREKPFRKLNFSLESSPLVPTQSLGTRGGENKYKETLCWC